MEAQEQQQAPSAVVPGSHARLRRGTKDIPWDEKVRRRIKTSMIVNRLTDHIRGIVDLTATQVRAAEILLRKTLPDLATVELQAGDGGPILIVTGIMRPDEPKPMIDQANLPKIIEHVPQQPDKLAPAEAKPLTDKVEQPTKDEAS